MKACLSLVAASFMCGCSSSTEAPLPNPTDIQAIRVQGGPPQYDLDRWVEIHDHYAEVLNALKPNRIIQNPNSTWAVMGTLKITTKDGEPLGITLFGLADDRVAFEMGGSSYMAGSSKKLGEVLTTALPPANRNSKVELNVAGPAQAWNELLAAMARRDEKGIRQLTTPAGFEALKNGLAGGDVMDAFEELGKKAWRQLQVRWQPSKNRDRAECLVGPEAKEHTFVFRKTADGWKLDEWRPGF
jgi:hypothetical protein